MAPAAKIWEAPSTSTDRLCQKISKEESIFPTASAHALSVFISYEQSTYNDHIHNDTELNDMQITEYMDRIVKLNKDQTAGTISRI